MIPPSLFTGRQDPISERQPVKHTARTQNIRQITRGDKAALVKTQLMKQFFYNILIWLGINGVIGGVFVTLGLMMTGDYISLIFSTPFILVGALIYWWADKNSQTNQ